MIVSQSFDVDEKTRDLLIQMRPMFGAETNGALLRKAIALANLVRKCVGDDGLITLQGSRETMTVKISE